MKRRTFLTEVAAIAGSAWVSAPSLDASPKPKPPQQGAPKMAPPVQRDEFVRAAGGELWVGNQVWRPFGVHYWPRYATAQRICGAVLWYDPVRYQPEVVEKDFSILQDVGANCVAIALVPGLVEPEFWFQETHLAYADYQGPLADRSLANLFDVFDRAAKHGLRVGCYLLGCHPFHFNEKIAHYWLVKAGLKDDPRIWAFDIAWEPHLVDHTNHRWRKKLDPDWNVWVLNRYGSIEAAVADWGYLPKKEVKGSLPSPDPTHLHSPGPWDGWVAAYARFVHNYVGARYRTALARLKQLDPHHLFGAHTVGLIGQILEGLGPQTQIPARGGDVTYYHDAQAVGPHLDYVGVEWRVHGLSVHHAKLWSGGKPVIFGEFGFDARGGPDAKVKQAQVFREYFQTIVASGAQGAIAWWWPGGARMCEGGSDFGLIEPDGSRRPVLEVFKEYAPKFSQPRPKPAPAAHLERLVIEPDRYAPPFFANCNHVARKLDEHLRAGRRVRVVTAGTDTDSTTCPLVTVTGQPYRGRGILAHLDAQFVEVSFRRQDGHWEPLAPGAKVAVPARGDIHFRVLAQNIQQATWKAGEGVGCVALEAWGDGKPLTQAKLASDAAFQQKACFELRIPSHQARQLREISLQLTARGRCRFGDRYEVYVGG